MIVDSIYHVGDIVWAMKNNRPTEFMISGFVFDSSLIGCDGTIMTGYSIEKEKSASKTSVKYYLIETNKLFIDKSFIYKQNCDTINLSDILVRFDIEKHPYYLYSIFKTKKDLVYSLLDK
jgi:hypothetical protein